MGGGQVPNTPNPYSVSAAQSVTNIETATATVVLNNSDTDRPEATIHWAKLGDYALSVPTRDANGNITGSVTYNVPQFKSTITLKPAEQAIFDKNQLVRSSTMDVAVSQIGLVKNKLGVPVNFGTLDAFATPPTAPTLANVLPAPGAMVTSIDPGDLTVNLTNTRDAIYTDVNFQITNDRQTRIITLNNQGITAGMDAFTYEMEVFDKASNHSRTTAWLAAQTEQTRAIQARAAVAGFANSAQAQMFQQATLMVDFSNNTLIRTHEVLMNLAAFLNSVREAKRNELLLERQSELNEISALMHGGQVQIPQFQAFVPGHVDSTNLTSAVYNSAQMDLSKYQGQMQQQNDLWGGLLGAAGTIMGGPLGGRIAKGLFG
jgi:hypothetical protein